MSLKARRTAKPEKTVNIMEDSKLLTGAQGSLGGTSNMVPTAVDPEKQIFPFCIVWTPMPILTYFIPLLGHMGIATSTGVIRDFAGPYHVSEDNMAFGKPTKYWQLNYAKAKGGVQGWDAAVAEASEIYKTRMHNIFCDNCHSHVAKALNLMSYDNSNNWNMVNIGILMVIHGRYVSFLGFLKTWMPFCILAAVVTLVCLFLR